MSYLESRVGVSSVLSFGYLSDADIAEYGFGGDMSSICKGVWDWWGINSTCKWAY